MADKIFELYNNADGNDDILSDIGNVGMEVQRGMWALMPYSVNDGDGVVNLEEMLNEKLDKTYADKVSSFVSDKFNLGIPKYIKGGNFGQAYSIGNKVIKVTTDYSEAIENGKLLGKDLQSIAIPYNVYEITPKSGSTRKTWVIILEKLRTNIAYFTKMYTRLNYVMNLLFQHRFYSVLYDYMFYRRTYNNAYKEDIDKYMLKNPEDAKYYYDILKIIDELNKYGVSSTEFSNPKNMGFKSNGNIGFFDVGFSGDIETSSENLPQKLSMTEDSTALYSTDGDIGNTGFPTYAQGYYGDDTDTEDVDKHYVNERQLHWIPGSQGVTIKKKCRLGGNGDGTSTACNTGDINNLELKTIKENIVESLNSGNDLIKLPTYSMGRVLDIARKYYPYTELAPTTLKGTTNIVNRYFIGKKNDVSYSENGLKNGLIDNVIHTIVDFFKRMGISEVRHVKESHSVYFSIVDTDIRISDHYNTFNGLNFIVQWNTDINSSIPIIKRVINQTVNALTENNMNVESLSENSLDDLKSTSTKGHIGWLLPDNTFIEIRNHIVYLNQRYKGIIDQNNENPDNDAYPDADLYRMAYDEGLVRIWMEFYDGGPELGIRGKDINRIKDIVENVYYEFFANRQSRVYIDVFGSTRNSYKFYLPQDKEEFANFVFGSGSDNNGVINEVGEGNLGAYEYEKIQTYDSDKDMYVFRTEDGDKYDVIFKNYSNNSWEVKFAIGGSFSVVVNKGRVYRVMSTLLKIINDFVNLQHPDEINISPVKKDNKYDNNGFPVDDNSRFDLYMAYIKKNIPSDYVVYAHSGDIDIKKNNFVAESKKNVVVNENSTTFAPSNESSNQLNESSNMNAFVNKNIIEAKNLMLL